jgi:hypothetical protein
MKVEGRNEERSWTMKESALVKFMDRLATDLVASVWD